MRQNILIAIIVFLYFSCRTKTPTWSEYISPVSSQYNPELKPFYQGVASGDPLSDRVIIWTRITPEQKLPSIEVKWEVAKDTLFNEVVKTGISNTSHECDYTVKVDVADLEAGHTYFYRFHGLEGTSLTGRTKTISRETVDSLKFAVISCSNFQWGYFNAYGRIAEKIDIDAVLHLGDYIYEYGIEGYGDTTIGRLHLPEHEIITLEDYRIRYAQYRSDKDLIAAHQNHPFITIWDDHEVANDNYTDGAQNHQPETEGSYEDRMAAAVQAYYEWMPMREPEDRLLYRAFSFGEMAELIMLDGRLEGRDVQLDSMSDPAYFSKDRSMLGEEQLNWFFNQLEKSQAKWKLIGNQVIFSDLDLSPAFPHRPRNLDSWDGYPVEKNKIEDFLSENSIQNAIILTGDTHCSWAFEVVPERNRQQYLTDGSGVIALEIGTPSINSANYNEYVSMDTVQLVQMAYLDKRLNPHLKYTNLSEHGYVILTLTKDKARADWYYVTTVREPSTHERIAKSFTIQSGSPKFTGE